MTIKYQKAELVEKVTALRKLGLPSRTIAERLGLSKSRILAVCRDFGIPKWPMDTCSRQRG
jgi:hypothetical protein